VNNLPQNPLELRAIVTDTGKSLPVLHKALRAAYVHYSSNTETPGVYRVSDALTIGRWADAKYDEGEDCWVALSGWYTLYNGKRIEETEKNREVMRRFYAARAAAAQKGIPINEDDFSDIL